jgi:penicillin-binding protein activator
MKIISRLFLSVVYFAVIAGLSSCASTPKVTREDVSQQIDLSGNWNDTDSQLVSKEMISDVLSRPWVSDFQAAKNTKPRVIVGTVMNKSMEHITTEPFIKDLERELINSGRIGFVASKEQRGEVRDERMEQQTNAAPETVKSMGKEYGADFMLKGQINSIEDAAGNKEVKYYQVDLELIDMQSNEKVWIGQKKIKKLVKRPMAKP